MVMRMGVSVATRIQAQDSVDVLLDHTFPPLLNVVVEVSSSLLFIFHICGLVVDINMAAELLSQFQRLIQIMVLGFLVSLLIYFCLVKLDGFVSLIGFFLNLLVYQILLVLLPVGSEIFRKLICPVSRFGLDLLGLWTLLFVDILLRCPLVDQDLEFSVIFLFTFCLLYLTLFSLR